MLGATATSFSAAAPIYTGWSAPVWLGPVVNSAAGESGPALSADGLSLFFGGPGADIWVSQRAATSDPWGAPVNVAAVNSTAVEFVPSLSSDGHWMFLASTRTGGFGGADLYQSYRADVHDDFGWQTPTNLGPTVNTTFGESGNGFFANGGTPQLFFGSDRLGPSGNSDLYMSQQQPDGTWGLPTRITELSTSFAENRPTLRQDGLEIFFYSNRTGRVGNNDLWTATRASVNDTWSTPVDLGVPINSIDSEVHPYLSADATMIVFSSARPGGSGAGDLYVITRAQIFPATKDECKNGGFERFGIFKNQGDCVSYVATAGENQPG